MFNLSKDGSVSPLFIYNGDNTFTNAIGIAGFETNVHDVKVGLIGAVYSPARCKKPSLVRSVLTRPTIPASFDPLT